MIRLANKSIFSNVFLLGLYTIWASVLEKVVQLLQSMTVGKLVKYMAYVYSNMLPPMTTDNTNIYKTTLGVFSFLFVWICSYLLHCFAISQATRLGNITKAIGHSNTFYY